MGSDAEAWKSSKIHRKTTRFSMKSFWKEQGRRRKSQQEKGETRRRRVTHLEGKSVEEDREDLVERNDVGILEDDPSDGSSGVVLSGTDGGEERLLDEEERSKNREELDDIVESELSVHVLDENTSGESSVGSDLRLLVGKTKVDQLEESLEERKEKEESQRPGTLREK